MPSASVEGARTIATPKVPAAVIDALRAMKSPIMIAHVVPDADALGSMIGMALAWTSDSRAPKIALPDGSLSKRLAFLVRDDVTPKVADDADFALADGFVVLDTAKQPRCNIGKERKETDWVAGRPVVNIDHHGTNTEFGTVNWIVPDSCSSCELVYYLLVAAGCPIDARIASLLYAGIQTDTIGFSLPTTSASAFQAAAGLASHGADIATLGEKLCFSRSQAEFDLLRAIYANTRTLAGGGIAYSSASYDDIHGAGCTAADIDDQINVPRSLDGVRLAILFSEGNKGKTRMNFRGSGNITVVELAGEFGGGGHSQAAGAILDCGVEEAMQKVLPAAEAHLKRFGPAS